MVTPCCLHTKYITMKNRITVNGWSVRLLRMMVSGIFLIAGFNHLVNTEKTVARIEKASFKGFAHFFGEPTILVILSGVAMLVAGISFLVGFKTRWAALVLIAILIPITLTIQVGQITTLGPLFKNVAILGGLLFFVLNDFNNKPKTNLS